MFLLMFVPVVKHFKFLELGEIWDKFINETTMEMQNASWISVSCLQNSNENNFDFNILTPTES